ncbi:MAG: glycosyltransferase family 4 protein [Actinomycetota bacterium]|nr:glycosyltransferase family 4 protein [Actinomycetota bacterium]
MPRIDQFVPSFARHDAIGNHVLQLRRLFHGAGYDSEIFFEHIDPRLAGQARHFEEADPRPDADRVLLYHASTHTDMNDWLISAGAAGQRIVVDYHNMTPARYFSAWEPRAARSMEQGRLQLAQLAPYVTGAVADSQYNADELADFGIHGAVVCPILLDLSDYHLAPEPAVAARLTSHPLWLFVGRLAPNKCQHDVVAAFAAYHRLYQPGSRLAIIGGATSRRYESELRFLADRLGVAGAVDFVGSAPFPELLAYFHRADVFVCLSEHEGFCVPVIEAMELGVPVVAYEAAAVTETVADAGLLLADKDPMVVAHAVHELLADDARRSEAVEKGRARAAAFALDATSQRWLNELGRIAPPGRSTHSPTPPSVTL